MPLQVSTITTKGELKSLEGEWIRLLAKVQNDLPFLLPEWGLTWWELFRQERFLIRDSLRVMIVRQENGDLVGLVPLMRTERPAVGPARARSLDFLGADPYITEQRAPIIDSSCGGDVARALAAHLLADETWDWIEWRGLQKETAFASELERELGVVWGVAQPANLVRLSPTWEEFKGGLKRNIKESLRRCYNSLKRDGMTARLVVAEAPGDVAGALEGFFKFHAMRAEQTDTIDHPDRFARERPRRFLETVCARLAARGVARVFTLHVDDTPVAVRIGFVLPDCLYLYYSGFDPVWGKYSVMTTTVAEAIKYAIDLGLPLVHLSMGADVSKSRWGPEMPLFYDARSVRPQLRSRAALKLFLAARKGLDQESIVGRILPKRRLD